MDKEEREILMQIHYTLNDNPRDKNHKGLGTQFSEFVHDFNNHKENVNTRLDGFDERLREVEKKQSRWKVTLAKVAAIFGLSGGAGTFAWLKWETFVEFLKAIGKV